MKLKANAGKKQSLQPKHNVVGPEKRQHDLPLAMRSRLVPMPSNFLKKGSTFCKTKPPNHQKFSESLKPTHHHHTLTTRARLFPLQIFQLQSVQHQQSKSPKELIQWHRSKSKAIHPTAITKQCHEWCHTQMGDCLTQIFFRVEQQAAGGEIHFLFRAFQLCISSTRNRVFRQLPPRWFSISIKRFELHRVVLVLQMAMLRVDRSLLWTFEFDVFWI